MKSFDKKSVTLNAAQEMIGAAIAKANELGMGIAVTIVDESGNLKAFARMDNAPLIAVDASRKKALTAVGMGLPSGEAWYNFIKDDPILTAGVHNFEDFILLGGGIPINLQSEMIGAIGISGGHYRQDEICALAALEIFNK